MLMLTGAKVLNLVDANKPYGEKCWTFSPGEIHEIDVGSGAAHSWTISDAKHIYLVRAAWPKFIARPWQAETFLIPEMMYRTISGRCFAISLTMADGSELCHLPATNDLTEGEATHLASLMRERYPQLFMNEFME